MEDKRIVELYFARSEEAIKETQDKYSAYCKTIAYNILANTEDVQECLNDMLRQAWNSIPPNAPQNLKAYLGKIIRNISLNRLKSANRRKRGAGQAVMVLDELTECIPAENTVETEVEKGLLAQTLNSFLATLSDENRRVFVRRYWYLSTVRDIAKDYDMSESKVKSILYRLRGNLKEYMEKEGFYEK